MHIEELLDEEVTALATTPAKTRQSASNPGTVGLAGQRVPIRVPRIRPRSARSTAVVRGASIAPSMTCC